LPEFYHILLWLTVIQVKMGLLYSQNRKRVKRLFQIIRPNQSWNGSQGQSDHSGQVSEKATESPMFGSDLVSENGLVSALDTTPGHIQFTYFVLYRKPR